MASIHSEVINRYVITVSPLEAEIELNRLAQQIPEYRSIAYQVDLNNTPYNLTKEELNHLIDLPYDLCIKCIMKLCSFDEATAKFLYKNFVK